MTNEVFNIDCMDYMRTLPDKFFDLAIADPPYGDGNQTDSGGGTTDLREVQPSRSTYNRFGGRFDRYKTCQPCGGGRFARYNRDEDRRNMGGEILKKIVGWDEAPQPEFFNELFRVSKHQIIWGGNYFSLPPTRCFIVWRKLTISEKFTMAMAEYAWTSFAANAKVVEMPPQGNPKDPRFHPTQKPVELYAWLLKNYAKDGDKIFDPMMGSQSSHIAAYKMGFDYVGCELDKEYFAKGCERFDRECRGLTKADNGKVYQQMELFN